MEEAYFITVARTTELKERLVEQTQDPQTGRSQPVETGPKPGISRQLSSHSLLVASRSSAALRPAVDRERSGLVEALAELPPGVDPLSDPALLDSNSAKLRGGALSTVLRLNEWEQLMREGVGAPSVATHSPATAHSSRKV